MPLFIDFVRLINWGVSVVEEVINFYGLGPFYFGYNNKTVSGSDWVSKRALFIFMYLLLEKKRTVSVEELIDIFGKVQT